MSFPVLPWLIACLGAGPASLAAAHELTALGHEVVVFEKRLLPGGLNTTGVAPYKMRADESLEERADEVVVGLGGGSATLRLSHCGSMA